MPWYKHVELIVLAFKISEGNKPLPHEISSAVERTLIETVEKRKKLVTISSLWTVMWNTWLLQLKIVICFWDYLEGKATDKFCWTRDKKIEKSCQYIRVNTEFNKLDEKRGIENARKIKNNLLPSLITTLKEREMKDYSNETRLWCNANCKR